MPSRSSTESSAITILTPRIPRRANSSVGNGVGGGPGVLEREEELVAARVDLVTACGRESLPDEAAVVGEDAGVGVAELVHELRRALDVGEEERDGSVRKVTHASLLREESPLECECRRPA